MQTCLVTGGAGFIGSHLAAALLKRGDRVRVLDNLSSGNLENLSGLNVELIIGDIRDPQQVKNAVQGVDVVFHLAAFISAPQSLLEPQTCFAINVQGTLNLFDAAKMAGIRRAVVASSAAVYGDSTNLPLKEEEPVRPLTPYGASKAAIEIYSGLYTLAMGLPVVALRFFNVYGPRQSVESQYAAAVPIFLHHLKNGLAPTIYGDGTVKRDFIYVEDVVEAITLAASSPAADGQVFNVCTGQEISLLMLLDAMYQLFPQAPAPQFAPPRAGDIYRSLGQPGKAEKLLGFHASTSLIEGLRQMVE